MPQPKDKTKIKDWKAKISVTLKGRRCSMKTEFRRGRTSWNKGTKGLTKANSGSFKKGSIPKNYMGGYKVCKDGIYVRVGKKNYYYKDKYGKKTKVGKYESLARKKWRDSFGEIPKGLIIFHKDGDVYNNELENLKLISRGELLKNNTKTYNKICVICGLEFIAKQKRHKTCNAICREEYAKILNKDWVEKNKEKIKIYKRNHKLKMKNNN